VVQADPFADFQKYRAEVADCHFLDQTLYVDFKTWLVDDILVKVDRATMAHSLEARAPFLDHRLVEFAASLPPEWKLKGLRKKHLLKASQRCRLPRRIVERRKHGFNAPVSDWFSGGLMELARSVTSDGALGEWFDQREIDCLWQDHCGKRADNGLKLFGLTCFGLWLRQGR
jgi:asparagine synthase (glutamine-hydrolysing)